MFREYMLLERRTENPEINEMLNLVGLAILYGDRIMDERIEELEKIHPRGKHFTG